jgi:hypothetical protein
MERIGMMIQWPDGRVATATVKGNFKEMFGAYDAFNSYAYTERGFMSGCNSMADEIVVCYAGDYSPWLVSNEVV